MATAKDFLQNDDGDIAYLLGDLVIGESDDDHVVDLIASAPPAWKEYPLCGVGVDNYLNSSGMQQFLRRAIIQQLTTDGFGDISVNFNSINTTDFTVYAVRD